MKIIGWLSALLLTLFIFVYVLAFTSFGNSIVAPIIEERINKETDLTLKFETFELGFSHLNIKVAYDQYNKVSLEGDFSLLTQALDLSYKVELSDLNSFSKLAQKDLTGKLFTNGTISGELNNFTVQGKSDLASSQTNYTVSIAHYKPTSLDLNIQKLQIDKLLAILGEPQYASSNFDANIQLSSLEVENLQGEALLTLKDGKINTKVMHQNYGVTLPQTTFNSSTVLQLKGKDLNYKLSFLSNLATINSQGHVVPQKLALDLNYNVDIKELALLKPLTQTNLRGAFMIKGEVKGDKEKLNLNGISDIAGSDTVFSATLKEFQAKNLQAQIKNLDLAKALYMLHQPHYTEGSLDADIKINNTDLKKLDGDVTLSLKNGNIDPKVMLREHNVTLPKTTYNSKTTLKLAGNKVHYTTKLLSNLAQISSQGKVIPSTLGLDLKYDLKIQELALFTPIIQADLQGEFNLKGEVKGDKKELSVIGASDLAGSQSTFDATLKEFKAHKIYADIKDLKLSQALSMVKMPNYTEGLLSVSMKIDNASTGALDGEIKTNIKGGKLNSSVLTKEMEFTSAMPQTTFTMQSSSKLKGDSIHTEAVLNSTLASLQIKKAHYDLANSSLQSDYTLQADDLDKFFFITERHLRGGIKATGELKKDKDLEITTHIPIAQGSIDSRLFNNEFTADLKALQTLQLLHILIYPEIFTSSLDAQVHYNLQDKAGKLTGKLTQGKFTQNQLLSLLKQHANFDLYKEEFLGDIDAIIKQENIVSSLHLQSNKSSITTKGAKLNSKTKKVDASIDIVANKQTLKGRLQGDINAPKVSIDLEAFMKSKAGEKIKKEAQRGVEKLLKKLL